MTRLSELRGRHVVIWGAGVEGRAAAHALERFALPSSVTTITDDDPPDLRATALARADVIVKSPGVSPYRDDVKAAAEGRVLTGGTALWFAETGGERTIAVTGSKGKSTTSSLIAHLINCLGGTARLAGNVGRALLDLLDETPVADRWEVLELSSFQTAEVLHSPIVGVLTALFPEHLDWHGGVERYYDDKCNLFAHRADIVTVVNAANANVAARLPTLPNPVPYGVPEAIWADDRDVVRDGGEALIALADTQLIGHHNAVNLAGALTALRAIGVDISAECRSGRLAEAAASFIPLSHRLERVGDVGGRLVVDDSLSTAPDAAIAALRAFEGRSVSIIVGGHDRGLDYTALADEISRRTTPTRVLGVPESGQRIVSVLDELLRARSNAHVHVVSYDDFDDAVDDANRTTPVGGVILLSPGAPSFGRFRNYAERGQHFRALLGVR